MRQFFCILFVRDEAADETEDTLRVPAQELFLCCAFAPAQGGKVCGVCGLKAFHSNDVSLLIYTHVGAR